MLRARTSFPSPSTASPRLVRRPSQRERSSREKADASSNASWSRLAGSRERIWRRESSSCRAKMVLNSDRPRSSSQHRTSSAWGFDIRNKSTSDLRLAMHSSVFARTLRAASSRAFLCTPSSLRDIPWNARMPLTICLTDRFRISAIRVASNPSFCIMAAAASLVLADGLSDSSLVNAKLNFLYRPSLSSFSLTKIGKIDCVANRSSRFVSSASVNSSSTLSL
mmetsp:Transcript_7590/g.17882  ORF Transcript_7590/g.17882 Transcript_7590/m.17882 type:complete len:223 (-) Transcript_7590:703-1371(-)